MRVARWFLTAVLLAVVLIDGIVAYRLLRYGWPKRLVPETVNGIAQIHAVPISMDSSAWLSIALYALVHFAVCYGVWRLWRSRETVHL